MCILVMKKKCPSSPVLSPRAFLSTISKVIDIILLCGSKVPGSQHSFAMLGLSDSTLLNPKQQKSLLKLKSYSSSVIFFPVIEAVGSSDL